MKKTQSKPTFRLRSNLLTGCLLAAALTAVTVSAKVVDIEERSLPIDAATKLVAELNEGDIKVTSQAGDSVKVMIKRTVHKLSEEDAAKVLAQIATKFESEGDHILLKEKSPESSREWKKATGFSRVQYDLAYEVQVPPSFDLKLGTVDGDVTVDSVDGSCVLATVDGDVFLANAGGTVKAQTVDGDIMIKQAGGTVDAQSVDGDIDVVSKDSIQAQTVDGDIVVTFQGQPSKNNTLRTIDGDIDVRVVRSAAVSFDVRTMDGTIQCDLSLDGAQIKKRSMSGSLNGGGKKINLKTMDGDISILGL